MNSDVLVYDAVRTPFGKYGGALAGTRILGTLARSLARTGQRWGVAAICMGVGQGLAVVVENVRSGS